MIKLIRFDKTTERLGKPISRHEHNSLDLQWWKFPPNSKHSTASGHGRFAKEAGFEQEFKNNSNHPIPEQGELNNWSKPESSPE